MSFNIDDKIDNRFQVEGVCSNQGGMGEILYVKDNYGIFTERIVLKYCKSDVPELLERFRKEVKILEQFNGNKKVLNSLYSNIDSEPPYFIMKHYVQGDLTNIIELVKNDKELQEKTFLSMIDCIKELHEKGIFHRDIKPQNFLLDGENILVSDLGLGIKTDSISTRLTRTNMYAGSQGYIPPEFMEGGFKYADERGDIFMLGKSFYTLLSQRDPSTMYDKNINPIIFQILEKACHFNKDKRYDNLEQLSQAIKMAYDIILGRNISAFTEVKNILNNIKDNNFNAENIDVFFQKLLLISKEQQKSICLDLDTNFFIKIINFDIDPHLENFFRIYTDMVEESDYNFSFAETITNNMKIIFDAENITFRNKAISLDLAIRSAYLMNRFAAMDKCKNMITSVLNNELGLYISAIIMKNSNTFISDIEASDCQCDFIINSISAIK
ncbi:protein kinase [Aliarcobacter cryaerophilus]|uniref:protein kinase domain-containing protein n=1 Tax=Aliarcobacter cryaerophilus TaxID=28198 RepID=UPI003DA57411